MDAENIEDAEDDESPVRRDIAKDALLLKAAEDATEGAAGETVKFLWVLPLACWDVEHTCVRKPLV